ncbi:hypothetical protein HMPREF9429_01767, partial [Megasphaera micronuciformis F0359]
SPYGVTVIKSKKKSKIIDIKNGMFPSPYGVTVIKSCVVL